MNLLKLVAFRVEGKTLLQQIPMTLEPIPGRPLRTVRLQLFLLHPEEVEDICLLIQAVKERQEMSPWLVTPENPRDGFRFQGYITACHHQTLRADMTVLTLDMDLIHAGS